MSDHKLPVGRIEQLNTDKVPSLNKTYQAFGRNFNKLVRFAKLAKAVIEAGRIYQSTSHHSYCAKRRESSLKCNCGWDEYSRAIAEYDAFDKEGLGL